MKKKLLLFCLFVLSLATLSGCMPKTDSTGASNSLDLDTTNRYELLIGLNDVDAGKQLVDTQQATEIVKMKLLSHVSGVTITISNGYYYVGALIVDETTLNCVIYGADDEAIAAVVKEINSELNVPVLVSKSTSQYRLITP
ncbi:MAG: hypothetical protein HY818_09430 [Acetobacterium woodii]|nr:hypothetical protein [Acetobacterium woodii]